MKLFLSSVLLAFVFQAAPIGAQERPAVRPIPIPFRENGYSNFESQAFNTKAEFDAFIAGTANQIGWNNRPAFIEALQKANVDFAHEAVVILRHTESSGSVRVTFAPLTPNTRKLICWMRGSVLAGGGTMDMAYYGKALVVSRSAVSEVEFRDVVGGSKERELPPVIFQITAEASPDQTPRPADKVTSANHREEAISRLFGIVNELKSEPDTAGAALLQSEIADVLWKFDEPGARVIFRAAFDSVRQLKADSSSVADAEAKAEALRDARRRANAIKLILRRYGLHDRKGAETWLQDFENEQEAGKKKSNSQRMSLARAELLAQLAAALAAQDAGEALRLGVLSLNAESIPPSFAGLLMALRRADKAIGDELFRQALVALRANGMQYDAALLALTNYQFFANGSPVPDANPTDVTLITQYFVDAAAAQSALLGGGQLTPDQQISLSQVYSFLNARAVPIMAQNAPAKLTLLQTNLAELSKALTPAQLQQAEMLASSTRTSPISGRPDDANIEARIRRAEQEKNADTRDWMFRNLVSSVMWTQPEKALELAQKIDDLPLRAQAEDDVYLVMLAGAFRGGSNENARDIALKMNDKPIGARWLAEIATQRSSLAAGRAMNLLSEAYTIANKSDHDAAKVEALLFIAQQFLKFDRERAFDILSEALKTVNRVEPKPLPPMKPGDSTIRTISFTMVNGKERSTALRPTLNSIDFNEVADFVQLDYVANVRAGRQSEGSSAAGKIFHRGEPKCPGCPANRHRLRTVTGRHPASELIRWAVALATARIDSR
jgi:hypothetical protein